jgi:RNA polymerase sigma-32 factor
MRQAMSSPLLSREREQVLIRRWRDRRDERAMAELVTAFGRLVVAVAARYRRYGLPLSDLVQEAYVGLLEGVRRFDPDREVRFATYATWWIRSAVQDYVLRNWSIVRTGTTASQKALFFNLRRLKARIHGAAPGSLDAAATCRIADELRVPASDVRFMDLRLAAGDQSLDVPLAHDGAGTWADRLIDDGPSPEDIVIGLRDSETRSNWLKQALDELSPRERWIVLRRNLSESCTTLENLGQSLGVSKERVRQLETRALNKLR